MDNVIFTEEDHKYEGSRGIYTSATTVIGKYKQPYDMEYWSLYKAIERYITEKKGENFWRDKKRSLGYENMIPYFLDKIADRDYLEVIRQEILLDWKIKKEEACVKGTAFHKGKEDETNNQIIDKETALPVIIDEHRDFHNIKSGIYAEMVLWLEDFIDENGNLILVAGQADKVIVEDLFVDIDDYKTSKFIDKVSFKHYINGHQMMQYPLDNLMDCNLQHYTVQLSLYGYMLERKGFTVRRLRIYHTITDKWIVVPYLREEVIKMLNHYGKKQKQK